jgi:predicted transcriptional regulator
VVGAVDTRGVLQTDGFGWNPPRVLVQTELERGRSPLVSIPPFVRGFSRH